MKNHNDYGTPEFIAETYAMSKFNSHEKPDEWMAAYRGFLDCYNKLSLSIEDLDDKKWSAEILLDAAKSALTQLQSTNEAKDKECIAAEKYIEYLTTILNCPDKRDDEKMLCLYKKWQQLKQQKP